jgi:hypothetical protein
MRTVVVSCAYSLLTLGAPLVLVAADPSWLAEDFEGDFQSNRWSFWEGREFPGAKGSFERTAGAAHEGRYGGQLHFDFTGGGNYVAAQLNLSDSEQTEAAKWNALQLWLNHPEGNEVVFRYTDSAGQTLQKQVECAGGRWVQVTIPFSGWGSYWGGPKDGKIHGPPKTLGLLVDKGQQQTGAMSFDDLRLVKYNDTPARVTYPAYRFEAAEGWRARADGNGGSTRLEGTKAVLDFTQGAKSITLAVPDHVLLGKVDRIRFRVNGSAAGHPVRLIAHTHFMTFHKLLGEFSGEGEQDLVTEGPPGPGWAWYGGENDGNPHGPLRLTDLQFAANGKTDRCELELKEVAVEASCAEEKRCLLVTDVAAETEIPTFRARMRALTDQPLEGQLRWTLRNWEGDVLRRGETPMTVPTKATLAECELPLEKGLLSAGGAALRFVEADFVLDVPGQKTAPAQAVWLAPPDWQVDAALEPDSPFGMGVYLNRYGGDARGLAVMEQTAQMAAKAGAKWTREDFSWDRLEPRKGEFDWRFTDNLVACAKRNGITVYAIAAYWSHWTKPYSQEGIADYLNYVRAMVRHYKSDIHHWEIWNEPNIFFWQGPKEMYGELLTRSYAAIKETDPQAQVLGLSTAGIDYGFIDKMLALKTPFDVLTIHPYRTYLNDLDFIKDLKRASDKAQLPDGRRRPVWLTEMGWSTFTPHNALKQDFAATTLRAQAELIARSYLCAIASGVEPRTFWYDFRNDGDDPVYFEHQMGIVYRDFRPKPAYVAFGTLAQVLKGTKLDRAVAIGEDTIAYQFKAVAPGGKDVLAVWNPQKDVRVTVPMRSAKATRVNAVGESVTLSARGGAVAVELKKGAPVYLLPAD